MIQRVTDFLSRYVSRELVVFFVAMLPILELRAALPLAKVLGLPLASGYLLSILGNAIPVPFIILLIKKILDVLSRRGPLKRIAQRFTERGKAQGGKLVQKYPRSILLGLFLFVAIPIPGTGAWTGSLVAAFLDLPARKTIPVIMLGILGASVIMTILSYAIPGAFGL